MRRHAIETDELNDFYNFEKSLKRQIEEATNIYACGLTGIYDQKTIQQAIHHISRELFQNETTKYLNKKNLTDNRTFFFYLAHFNNYLKQWGSVFDFADTSIKEDKEIRKTIKEWSNI